MKNKILITAQTTRNEQNCNTYLNTRTLWRHLIHWISYFIIILMPKKYVCLNRKPT